MSASYQPMAPITTETSHQLRQNRITELSAVRSSASSVSPAIPDIWSCITPVQEFAGAGRDALPQALT